MTLSLGEVAAEVRKAARGAGLDWGLADEAGQAARWLCAQGLDGVGVMRAVLERPDAARVMAQAVTLSDAAHLLHDEPIIVEEVAVPAVLLPFAAQAARQVAQPVEVAFGAQKATTDGTALCIDGPVPASATRAIVTLAGPVHEARQRRTRAAPAPGDWTAITRLAALTYAPATEESRRKGAGAGTHDTD